MLSGFIGIFRCWQRRDAAAMEKENPGIPYQLLEARGL
jgi:hypothetical protein